MNSPCGAIRLFATDIDDTILGDPRSAALFKDTWESLDAERRPLLVYNTGRSIDDVRWLAVERRIPGAEFVIGALGTEVFDPVDAGTSAAFAAEIAASWDAATVRRVVEMRPGVQIQGQEYLNPCKLSWHWHRASAADVVRLETQLKDAGLEVTVLYTSGVFLDVIPARAGKGNALSWLCRRIEVKASSVLVAGASGNNASMFQLPEVRGIIVGNASRELFNAALAFRPFIAPSSAAGGVIAGLRHFGVLANSDVPVAPGVGL